MHYNGGYLIGQISKLTNRRVNELLKKSGVDEINAAQGTIIFVLSKEGPMQIKDIGKKTGLAKTSLTSMLDRMEQQGLIKKIENEEDRRSTIIEVCEDTKSFTEMLDQIGAQMDEELYRGLKAKEIERFEATLAKVLQNLEAQH